MLDILFFGRRFVSDSMSDRGRARGRGRSRPIAPGEGTGSEPSGAASAASVAPTFQVSRLSSCFL